MTRLCFILACSAAALTACAGLPPTIHPLFLARPADTTATDIAAPTVTVEMNNVLIRLPGSTATGCGLAGDYVREGNDVEVRLTQATGTNCDGPRGTFVTTVGPLPPGSYRVNVTLDGKPLVQAERANIS
jgi:hypothetical protein